jgi:hypothetical protein
MRSALLALSESSDLTSSKSIRTDFAILRFVRFCLPLVQVASRAESATRPSGFQPRRNNSESDFRLDLLQVSLSLACEGQGIFPPSPLTPTLPAGGEIQAFKIRVCATVGWAGGRGLGDLERGTRLDDAAAG